MVRVDNSRLGKISFILALLMIAATPAAFADGWEFWNNDSLEHDFTKDLSGKFEKEFRFHNGDEYYQHTDFGMTFNGSKKLEWGAGFRQIFITEKNLWSKEDRPYVFATYKWNMNSIQFSNRILYEHRFFSDKTNSGRFRNRFAIQFPQKKLKITPYIADEVFFIHDREEPIDFSANRLYLGVKFKTGKNLEWDVYYLRQSKEKEVMEGEYWKDFDVMGVKLKIDI
ncbi:MAG: DUF2490 domain-containing protein [Firmicutes bacterium]|nr:DUF2490 domain-containing protein [Bacillota bacterium]